MCGMVGKEALKAFQGYKDTNSDKERKKKWCGNSSFSIICKALGGRGSGGWVGATVRQRWVGY